MALSLTATAQADAATTRPADHPNGTANATPPPDWRAAQQDIPSYPTCYGKAVAWCIVSQGSGKRMLVVGDSLARMWLPAFRKIASRNSLTLAVAIEAACPWARHLLGLSQPTVCDARREDWYDRIIPSFNPDIIVLVNRAYDAPGNELNVWIDKKRVAATEPQARALIEGKMATSIKSLHRTGRQIVVLEPTPLPVDANFDPISCIAAGKADCSFTVSPSPTPLTVYDRHLATGAGVASLNLNGLACHRFPICDAIADGKIVRRDHTHLTATFARALNPKLEALLRQQHVLAPASTSR